MAKSDTRPANWRKMEIITAAAECFMERGYHATSVDDVAARLNCTKGRIYHHYRSKTELFFDVHREGMDLLFRAQDAIDVTGLDPRDRLIAMLRAHALAMLEHHTFENVVAQGVQVHRFDQTSASERATMKELIASRDVFEDRFKDVLEAAIAAGLVPDMDVSIAVKTLLGGLQWSIFWYRPKKRDSAKDRRALADRMVAPLLSGLGLPAE